MNYNFLERLFYHFDYQDILKKDIYKIAKNKKLVNTISEKMTNIFKTIVIDNSYKESVFDYRLFNDDFCKSFFLFLYFDKDFKIVENISAKKIDDIIKDKIVNDKYSLRFILSHVYEFVEYKINENDSIYFVNICRTLLKPIFVFPNMFKFDSLNSDFFYNYFVYSLMNKKEDEFVNKINELGKLDKNMITQKTFSDIEISINKKYQHQNLKYRFLLFVLICIRKYTKSITKISIPDYYKILEENSLYDILFKNEDKKITLSSFFFKVLKNTDEKENKKYPYLIRFDNCFKYNENEFSFIGVSYVADKKTIDTCIDIFRDYSYFDYKNIDELNSFTFSFKYCLLYLLILREKVFNYSTTIEYLKKLIEISIEKEEIRKYDLLLVTDKLNKIISNLKISSKNSDKIKAYKIINYEDYKKMNPTERDKTIKAYNTENITKNYILFSYNLYEIEQIKERKITIDMLRNTYYFERYKKKVTEISENEIKELAKNRISSEDRQKDIKEKTKTELSKIIISVTGLDNKINEYIKTFSNDVNFLKSVHELALKENETYSPIISESEIKDYEINENLKTIIENRIEKEIKEYKESENFTKIIDEKMKASFMTSEYDKLIQLYEDYKTIKTSFSDILLTYNKSITLLKMALFGLIKKENAYKYLSESSKKEFSKKGYNNSEMYKNIELSFPISKYNEILKEIENKISEYRKLLSLQDESYSDIIFTPSDYIINNNSCKLVFIYDENKQQFKSLTIEDYLKIDNKDKLKVVLPSNDITKNNDYDEELKKIYEKKEIFSSILDGTNNKNEENTRIKIENDEIVKYRNKISEKIEREEIENEIKKENESRIKEEMIKKERERIKNKEIEHERERKRQEIYKNIEQKELDDEIEKIKNDENEQLNIYYDKIVYEINENENLIRDEIIKEFCINISYKDFKITEDEVNEILKYYS